MLNFLVSLSPNPLGMANEESKVFRKNKMIFLIFIFSKKKKKCQFQVTHATKAFLGNLNSMQHNCISWWFDKICQRHTNRLESHNRNQITAVDEKTSSQTALEAEPFPERRGCAQLASSSGKLFPVWSEDRGAAGLAGGGCERKRWPGWGSGWPEGWAGTSKFRV